MNKILNITIEKMQCEKKKSPFGPIQISSNNQIINVSATKMLDSSDGISVGFKYITKYLIKDDEIGSIELDGKVFYNGENFEKILDLWNEEKKFNPHISTNIINIILAEASVTAVIIANQMRLPPPIPMPRTRTKKMEADTSYID